MSALTSLQNAMAAALRADAALTTLLGGAHIFDELPRGAKPPFVEFSLGETRDWSSVEFKAHEHFLQLSITSNERSRKQAQAIAQRIETILDQAALTLDAHRLINLRLTFWSVARNPSQGFGATLRFRATTEPLS